MQVKATTNAPESTDANTIAIGIFEDEALEHDLAGAPLQALVESGEAKRSAKKTALYHADGRRYLLVGLGKRAEFNAEGARIAAATAHAKAGELGTKALCWLLPTEASDDSDEIAAGLVEGTVLADYRFDQFKSKRGDDDQSSSIDELLISAQRELEVVVAAAATVATAQNAARDLQNSPANVMTPSALAERAQQLADELDGLGIEISDRDQITAREMGAFAAVAQGSAEEPRMIVLHYEGPKAKGPLLGLVGKAVTFDTGGISIKPSAKMEEMKFDMSGGATVIEAVGAIARLQLPVRVLAVVGATENMPGGKAIKPGDIVTAMNGTTIEIDNTDAEGRLVLADCLSYAVEQGAERLVDLATLTGAIIVSLGSTYAGLMSNDDAWAESVERSGQAAGEPLWRLPLNDEFAEMMKGQYADLNNTGKERKAGSITAAEFLKHFVGDVPWAHLDIAGTAWNIGRPYASKGGSGFGVRLLVELAKQLA